MKPILSTALNWVSSGYPVIPIKYQSKRPSLKYWEPYQTKLPTFDELAQWFRTSLTNIALITGWQNLLVIDFDIQEVFDYWYSLYPISTYMVKTSRGMHVYLQTIIKAANYHSDLLDIKADRGYVLIPPSIHPSGYEYQIFDNSPILTINQLSDILPAEFTPEPEKVCSTLVKTSSNDNENHFQLEDPWKSADESIDLDGAVRMIRSRLPILSYFPNATSTSRDGRWWVDVCPFHDDHNPSFWIDAGREICGCRVCNVKELDVINLHAKLNKIGNREAIRELVRKI